MLVECIQSAVKGSLNSTDRYTYLIHDVPELIVHTRQSRSCCQLSSYRSGHRTNRSLTSGHIYRPSTG